MHNRRQREPGLLKVRAIKLVSGLAEWRRGPICCTAIWSTLRAARLWELTPKRRLPAPRAGPGQAFGPPVSRTFSLPDRSGRTFGSGLFLRRASGAGEVGAEVLL